MLLEVNNFRTIIASKLVFYLHLQTDVCYPASFVLALLQLYLSDNLSFELRTAAESMHALPDIEVNIVEYSEVEHNLKNGIDRGIGRALLSSAVIDENNIEKIEEKSETNQDEVEKKEKKDVKKKASDVGSGAAAPSKKGRKSVDNTPKEKEQMYYLVSCKDNGCGEFDS
jgi:hypothetical protein